MALADTMVVMNSGRVEQVGTPYDIYNRPASEFVARFMGGHNVIKAVDKLQPDAIVAVRNDGLQVEVLNNEPASAVDNKVPFKLSTRLLAEVVDVEYQGTHVLLGLAPVDNSVYESNKLMAMVKESDFLLKKIERGQKVMVSWNREQAHCLNVRGH